MDMDIVGRPKDPAGFEFGTNNIAGVKQWTWISGAERCISQEQGGMADTSGCITTVNGGFRCFPAASSISCCFFVQLLLIIHTFALAVLFLEWGDAPLTYLWHWLNCIWPQNWMIWIWWIWWCGGLWMPTYGRFLKSWGIPTSPWHLRASLGSIGRNHRHTTYGYC